MKDLREPGRTASACGNAEDRTDRRLSRALGALPQIDVDDDFARRVMNRIPERSRPDRLLRVDRASLGRRVAQSALVVLAAGMIAAVPLAQGIGFPAWMTVECLLCLEFTGITVWMSLGMQRQR